MTPEIPLGHDAPVRADAIRPPVAAPAAETPAVETPSTPAPRAEPTRFSELAEAIERVRPIPRGGAVVEVDAPGLGRVHLRITHSADGYKVALRVADPSVAAALDLERAGLNSALARGIGAGADVSLEIGSEESGGTAHGRQSPDGESRSGREPTQRDAAAQSNPSRTQPFRATETPVRTRGLVDVVA